MSSGSVVVIVVTHQGRGRTVDRCLDAVRTSGGFDRLVVVDNSGHTDVDTPPVDDVDLWLPVPNEGYGAAVNRGVDAASRRWGSADHVAVLNDDTRVGPAWLEPLLAALTADERVGAVQPKLLVAGSTPPLVNSVGVELDRTGAGTDVGLDAVDGPAWEHGREIELFTGGAVVFSAAFLAATGGFDERYFLYYEDVDLALRGGELGWRYRCEPAGTVEHWRGSSSAALGDELRRLQERNRLWVAFRFASPGAVGAALWLSIRRLRHEPRRAHATALASGLAGAPRRLVERFRARR